jgi:NTP pyrophosphatase (non-canonical NTP hydrolase)
MNISESIAMTFKEYSDGAHETANYPISMTIFYPALGLAGEAGEVCEKIKKTYRDDYGMFGPERKEQIKLELGDVLWYVTELADDLGFTLEDVARANLEKLRSRKQRGKINGEGDNR